MYEYRIEIVKVIDGDTVDVNIDLGFGVWMKKERVRLHGIDTPESRTRDLAEKQFGLLAKDFLKNQLTLGTPILKTHKDATGKFGRILGELLYIDNEETGSMVNINEYMIESAHAVAYHGQSKDDVAQQHLLNREILRENGSVERD
jgi:micrococcal nuclease